MSRNIRLGELFGIDIKIDLSWLLIVLLLTVNLALGFGQVNPDWSPVLTWSLALLATLLFFVSVLVHELAHSLVAQAQGIGVRDITLFLFGGVSNIQREPESPRAEFLITIVGPLSSLLIGIVLLAFVNINLSTINDPAQVAAEMNPLLTILGWLGGVNLLLAVFNMIPGFPLDGGRILRSIIWWIDGDLTRATRWASLVGQVVAGLFIAAGVAMLFGIRLPFFGTGFINGLWLAFIGWFLNNAAVQNYRSVAIRDMLGDVRVERLMLTNPPTVAVDTPVSVLVDNHIMRSDDHAFPVVEGEKLVGLVTLDDVRSTNRAEWDTTPVRRIMTPVDELVTVSPDENAADALMQLAERDVRQLPVLRDMRLEGLLRRRDVMRWLQINEGDRVRVKTSG